MKKKLHETNVKLTLFDRTKIIKFIVTGYTLVIPLHDLLEKLFSRFWLIRNSNGFGCNVPNKDFVSMLKSIIEDTHNFDCLLRNIELTKYFFLQMNKINGNLFQ